MTNTIGHRECLIPNLQCAHTDGAFYVCQIDPAKEVLCMVSVEIQL